MLGNATRVEFSTGWSKFMRKEAVERFNAPEVMREFFRSDGGTRPVQGHRRWSLPREGVEREKKLPRLTEDDYSYA